MAGAGSGQAGVGSGEARAWTPGRLGVPESEAKKFSQSFELLLWSRGPWTRQTNEKLWRCRWGKYHEAGKLFFPGSNKGRHCRGFGIKDSPLCHHYCDEVGSPCATEFVAYVHWLQSGGGGESAGAAARGSGGGGGGSGGSRASSAGAFETGAGSSRSLLPRNALEVLIRHQQMAHDAANAKELESLMLTKTATPKKGVFPFPLGQMEGGFSNAHQVMCPPRMLLSSLRPASCLAQMPLSCIPPRPLTQYKLMWRSAGLSRRKWRTDWSTSSRRGLHLPTRVAWTTIWGDSRASCIYPTTRVIVICGRRRSTWEGGTSSLARSGIILPASLPACQPASLPACLPARLLACAETGR